MDKKVGLVGLGRAGTVLAYVLGTLGYSVTIARRQPTSQTVAIKDCLFPVTHLEDIVKAVDLLFITTPDGVIEDITERLSGLLPARVKSVLHISGSRSSQVLLPLKAQGIIIGSWHPLQSLASVENALLNLKGTSFAYDGDEELLPWLSEVVEKLEGKLIVLKSPHEKPFYHAGACFSSNYLVTLLKMGMACLQQAGFTVEQAQEALLPLMRGTLNNLRATSPGGALTGPISRGDTTTIGAHLEALAQELPHIREPYIHLGKRTVELALEAGYISEQKYKEIRGILEGGVEDGPIND